MSRETTQLVQRFYDGLNEGNLEGAMSVCDPLVVVYTRPDQLSAIAPRGQRRVADYLRDWLESWDEYHTELEELREAGDQVVVLVRARARGKGSRFYAHAETADVFAVRDGKITSLRLYVDRAEALSVVRERD